MCLSIPSKIVEFRDDNLAVVDTMGVSRVVSLDLVDKNELNIGDFVLIHIGYAMNKIDTEEAFEILETFKTLMENYTQ